MERHQADGAHPSEAGGSGVTAQPRIPRGRGRAGGRFAEVQHTEPEVTLTAEGAALTEQTAQFELPADHRFVIETYPTKPPIMVERIEVTSYNGIRGTPKVIGRSVLKSGKLGGARADYVKSTDAARVMQIADGQVPEAAQDHHRAQPCEGSRNGT